MRNSKSIAIVKYVSNVISLRLIPPNQPLHWPIVHVKKSADTCIKTEKGERGFKSQLGFLLAWVGSGLYTTLVVSESNNGEVEISRLSLPESFTSTSLKVN